jgi:hypothetical protein
MSEEWNINYSKVGELLKKYELLPYIDVCYETYNSMGIKGILEDLKSYIDLLEGASK